MAFIYLIAILLWPTIQCLQTSSESLDYYTAAVVEYHPLHLKTYYSAAMLVNGQNYEKFIKTASENNVDIIVFPEYGLIGQPRALETVREKLLHVAGFIPDPEDEIIPCNNTSPNYSEILKRISCMAKKYAIYVVINLCEKVENDDECESDGDNQQLYNTNVAFNRDGAVIGRYRKWNLFLEEYCDRTSEPEISTFDTDFNVTFGLLTGYDIIYATPTLELLREKKITDLVYTSNWFNQIPFLSSLGTKAAFSYIHDINLLGSGLNAPHFGSSGSGIYAGKMGIIRNICPNTRMNALIIGKVPKMINGERKYQVNQTESKIFKYASGTIRTILGPEPLTGMRVLKEGGLYYYSRIITHSEISPVKNICLEGFCCNFFVQTTYDENLISDSTKYYRYRFTASEGKRSIDTLTMGLNFCSIIACVDDELDNCGRKFDKSENISYPLSFEYLGISVNMKSSPNTMQFPISLTTDLLPTNVNGFKYAVKKIDDEKENIKFLWTIPHNKLLVFGIFVRNFTDDEDERIYSKNQLQSTTLPPVTQP